MPTLIKTKDLDYFSSINLEVYSAFMSKVKVFNKRPAEHDQIYNQDPNLSFKPFYEVEAYIKAPKDWKSDLTKFGLDEKRDLIVYFSLDMLNQRGLEKPVEGSMLEFQDDKYLVIQINPNLYFNNLFKQFTYQVEVRRFRYESMASEDTVIRNY